MPRAIHTLVAEAEREFGALGAAQLAEKIHAKAHRLRMVRECPTPLDLAARFDLGLVRTPALELINQRLLNAMRTRDGRLVISVPPQEGKALYVGEVLLTTRGWVTVADVKPGDYVFHPSGNPTKVIAKSGVWTNRALYRVTTSDGRELVVDGNHLWTVQDRRRETSKGSIRDRVRSLHWETISTEEILIRGVLREKPRVRASGTVAMAYALRLPRQHPVQSGPVALPLDPWLFGAWLGDGNSRTAAITVGTNELEEMTSLIVASGALVISRKQTGSGWIVRFNIGAPCRDGFEARIRRLGLYRNKHIPEAYLTAGTEQRLALLQGLLDTDGSISTNGRTYRVEFTACRQLLAEQVLYLVRSLGWKATIRESAAKLNGREVGRRWRVCFTPEQGEMVPFRLARKAGRVQVPQSRGGERHTLTIKSVEPVKSGDTQCIQVESSDGLYLAGRDLVPTHNSNLVQWAIAYRLLDNPEGRIGYASYAASLARRGGRIVRGRVEANLAPGLRIAWDHRDASDWEIAGHRGGMYSVGVEGSLTGRPIDEGLVIDDPIKDLQDAESAAVLGYLMDWWETVAQTRIHPGAWVVVVQTRWAENDLAGRLIGEGWPYVNIPAQAEHGIPDALNRPAGEYLTSVLGRTPDDWLRKRGGVGERTWFALYQGVPSPPKGDIFNEDWFDRDRVTQRPLGGSPPVVVIDPADNTGSGDEAGIIVASVDATQRIYLGPDYSDHYTVGRWVRVALLAVARHDASGLVFEQSLSGLPRSIKTGWDQLRKQALVLHRLAAAGPIDPVLIEVAVTELAHRDDPDTTWEQYRQELIELWPLVAAVLRFTPAGPMIRRIKPQGSKEWRAKAASPSYEQRRVSHVGKLPQLEHQMVTWQPGQKSPDRMDAAVHAILLLSGASAATLATPTGPALPTRSTRLAANRGAALPRSTLIRR